MDGPDGADGGEAIGVLGVGGRALALAALTCALGVTSAGCGPDCAFDGDPGATANGGGVTDDASEYGSRGVLRDVPGEAVGAGAKL